MWSWHSWQRNRITSGTLYPTVLEKRYEERGQRVEKKKVNERARKGKEKGMQREKEEMNGGVFKAHPNTSTPTTNHQPPQHQPPP